ncbi:MAG: hypothetical protein ACR2K1_14615 [Saprospiraceae bacterium]
MENSNRKLSVHNFCVLAETAPPVTGIRELLRSILVLDERLNRKDSDDEYFEWGRKSHEQRLYNLKKEYAAARNFANTYSVDDLLARIEESQALDDKYCARGSTFPIFVKIIIRNKCSREIAHYRDLIEMKALFGELKPLEVLAQDEEALKRIFG